MSDSYYSRLHNCETRALSVLDFGLPKCISSYPAKALVLYALPFSALIPSSYSLWALLDDKNLVLLNCHIVIKPQLAVEAGR